MKDNTYDEPKEIQFNGRLSGGTIERHTSRAYPGTYNNT